MTNQVEQQIEGVTAARYELLTTACDLVPINIDAQITDDKHIPCLVEGFRSERSMDAFKTIVVPACAQQRLHNKKLTSCFYPPARNVPSWMGSVFPRDACLTAVFATATHL